MAHEHIVIDSDSRFIIDKATRQISTSSGNTTIMQFDHNSERLTFELPKLIDGHDMTKCNEVEVHYINIDSATKESKVGVYAVNDLQVDASNSEKATLSWLISNNATQYAGVLNFLIKFKCIVDGKVEYAWNTAKYTALTVSNGIDNGEIIAEEYADILAQWEERIADMEQGGGVSSWNDLTDKPFGVIGEGDKLEWDQDLCTPKTIIACASGGASTFFKVSDQVITAEDLANGAYSHLYTAFNEETSDIYCSFENGYIQQMEDGAVWIKAEDTWGNHMSGYEIFCYPENAAYPPGIYFGAFQYNMSQFDDRVVGLTIPGYGKFQKKKTLEMDYLPKQLRMGEAQGFDNTLTWEGNTAKLEQHPSEPGWFILSPVHVKWENLQNGFYLEAPVYGSLLVDYFDPENFPYGDCHSIDNTNPDDITIKHIDENGNEWPFIRFTPDGVLVYFSSDYYTDYYFGLEHYYGVRLHTLTIPGFAGFENAEVNITINPKYLPKARTVGKCMGDTVTPWEFNELVNALKEAGYIAEG